MIFDLIVAATLLFIILATATALRMDDEELEGIEQLQQLLSDLDQES